MPTNILHMAARAKEDEFYTQLPDIENELRHYRKHFQNKTVFCNCDDPFESDFFKYFVLNFNRLGLKELISTCYTGSAIANKQLSLYDVPGASRSARNGGKPYVARVTVVRDATGDGGIDMTDIAELFKNGENSLKELKGNGDFRSNECIKFLKKADIVVTNPPFSLFREYVSQLIEYKKKFLIIGNQNATGYKDFFPYLQNNEIWLGSYSGNMAFMVPPTYEPRVSRYWQDENGQKWRSLGNICWYTNLDLKKRHEFLVLAKSYSPEEYPKYDNYDAIEVSKVNDIPKDYKGIMGVPVTFLDKHNPEQFQILGLSQKYGYGLESIRTYNDFKEIRQDGSFTGSSGGKTNGNPVMAGKPATGNYYIRGDEAVYSLYSRIFIRNISL